MAELSVEDIRRTVSSAIAAAQPLADLRSGLQNVRTDITMLRDKQNQVLNAERYMVDMHQMFQRFATTMQNGQVLTTYMQQTANSLAYMQQRLVALEQYSATLSDYLARMQQQLGNIEVLQHQLVAHYQMTQQVAQAASARTQYAAQTDGLDMQYGPAE